MTGMTCIGKVQPLEGAPIHTCGRAAAGIYRGACVHEHVKISPLCPLCRDGIARNGATLCWECYQIDGHECPMGERVLVSET